MKEGTKKEKIPHDQSLLVLPNALRQGAYGLLMHDSNVLMCHTISGKRTIINFPGGGVDSGEQYEDTVVREFFEETGAIVEVTEYLYSSDGLYVNPDYPNNRLQCHYYMVRVIGECSFTATSTDVQKLEWISLNQLPRNDMLAVDVQFCEWLIQKKLNSQQP